MNEKVRPINHTRRLFATATMAPFVPGPSKCARRRTASADRRRRNLLQNGLAAAPGSQSERRRLFLRGRQVGTARRVRFAFQGWRSRRIERKLRTVRAFDEERAAVIQCRYRSAKAG
jgi:hypothetical protein